MKTMQELYSEIAADKGLIAELVEAVKAGKQEEFFRAHGCNATTKEAIAFVKTKLETGELTLPPDILEKILWS